MQVWTEIRRKVLVEKVPKRKICRDHSISFHTLAKMLQNVEPPGYQQRPGERPRPKLGLFLGVIEEILHLDETAPKKQRHTAKRVFERLREEHGYQGSESHVRRYLAENEHRHREAFVPLAQPPGEAQFDFGEAVVEIADVRRKVALAVMSLPYGDAFFVSAYPRECTEDFQAAHDTAFEFFDGVSPKITYDNTTVAVKKVLEGPNRELTTGFLRLASHVLFTHRFCRVARGNEKGHEESLVGYDRRNFLVPVPNFENFAELNAYLAERCEQELDRTLRGHSESKRERLEADRAAMLVFPTPAFESPKVSYAKANSLSLVRFDRNDYSVPTAYAHHDVVIIGGVETLKIVAEGHLVATRALLGTGPDLLRTRSLPGVARAKARRLRRGEAPRGLAAAGVLLFAAPTTRGRHGTFGREGIHQGAAALGASLDARPQDRRRARRSDMERERRRRRAPHPREKRDSGRAVQPRRPGAPTRRLTRSTEPHRLSGTQRGDLVKRLEAKSTVLLKHHLRTLQLPTIGAECEKVAAQASTSNVDDLTYLLQLYELELLEREYKAAERRMKAAKFPFTNSLATFDFLRDHRSTR